MCNAFFILLIQRSKPLCNAFFIMLIVAAVALLRAASRPRLAPPKVNP